jgi:transcriptional regulator with XRE-family HTH domain
MPDWVVSADHRALVAALIAIRTEAGLTQRDMSARLGRSHSIIAKIETGQRNVSVLEFVAWCRVARVNPGSALEALSLNSGG